MTLVRPKVSNLVASQLPEHIRNEQPKFVAFLEAYYRYLETNEKNLVNIRDLDTTLDGFVTHFKNELAQNLPYSSIDERFLLKHIKDLYLAKGSEASYDLLFKILFGKNVTLDYPSKQMFRASDGKWNQDISVFVDVTEGNVNEIVGKLVDVVTPNKIIRVLIDRRQYVEVEVERAIRVSDNVYELILDRRFFGDINVGDRLRYRNDGEGIYFSGDILATTSTLNVAQKGTGFKIGELYNIRNFDGYGTILKVKDVDANGGINAAEFIKYGIGYSTEFTSTLIPKAGQTLEQLAGTSVLRVLNELRITDRMEGFSETGTVSYQTYLDTNSGLGELYGFTINDGGTGYTSATVTISAPSSGTTATATATIESGVITGLTITDHGTGYDPDSPPTVTITGDGVDADIDALIDVGFGAWDGTYAGSVQREFGITTTDAQVSDETPAIIQVGLGAIANYPGYYINNDGFLDDAIYIQDSRYYQAYSYLIKIDETLESYQTAVKTLIHPAGMALFGEYDIRNEFDLSPAIESLIKILNVTAQDEITSSEQLFLDNGAVVGGLTSTGGIQKYVNDTPLYATFLALSPGDDDNTFSLSDTTGNNSTRTVPYIDLYKSLDGTEDDYDLATADHTVTMLDNASNALTKDMGIGAVDSLTMINRDLGTGGSLSGTTDNTKDFSKSLSTSYAGVTELAETTMADGSTRFGLSIIDMDKELNDVPVISEQLTYHLTLDVIESEATAETDTVSLLVSKPLEATSTDFDGNLDDETIILTDDDTLDVSKPLTDNQVVTEKTETTMAGGLARFGLAVIDSDKELATSYAGMSDTDAADENDLNRTTPAIEFVMDIDEGVNDEVTFSESGFINKNPYGEAGFFLNDDGIYVSDNYQEIT